MKWIKISIKQKKDIIDRHLNTEEYYFPLLLTYFANKVKTNGIWDLKNSISFDNENCQSKTDECRQGVTLCGFCTLKENIGNIHYGWLGRAIGISRNFLLRAASLYQSGGPDEEHDVAAIIIGMDFREYSGNLCDYVKQKSKQLKAKDEKRNLSDCKPCKTKYI